MGHVGLEELVGTAEMTDMRMSIDESRGNVQSPRVHQLGGFAPGMVSALAHIANPAVQNRDLHPFQYLAGIDVDEISSGYDEVRLDLPQSSLDQSFYLSFRTDHRASSRYRPLYSTYDLTRNRSRCEQ